MAFPSLGRGIDSGITPVSPQGEQDVEPRHFGVCVSALTSERNSVPVVMEKLLEYVEMHGLYTEGIYRKSGSANRMKELKQLLQEGQAVLSTLCTSLHDTSFPCNSLPSESICHFLVFKNSFLLTVQAIFFFLAAKSCLVPLNHYLLPIFNFQIAIWIL